MAVNTNTFKDLNDVLDALLTELNAIDIVGETRDVKNKVMLHDIELNGEDDTTLITKYTSRYNELNKYFKTKIQELNKIEISIDYAKDFFLFCSIFTHVKQKKQNLKVVIDCMNHIVDKMKRIQMDKLNIFKKTSSYNIMMNELNETIINKFEVKDFSSTLKGDYEENQRFVIAQMIKWSIEKQFNTDKQLETGVNQTSINGNKKLKVIYDSKTDEDLFPELRKYTEQQNDNGDNDIQTGEDLFPALEEYNENENDNDIQNILNSIDLLKKWSNRCICEVAFDSKTDGNGKDYNMLYNRIHKKSNIYLISFDNHNNIFGGYISSFLGNSDQGTTDIQSFIFSLIRNGVTKNTKYHIKLECAEYSFTIFEDKEDQLLYEFGEDVYVYPVGANRSHCKQEYYYYNEERNALVDNGRENEFTVARIIALQMK